MNSQNKIKIIADASCDFMQEEAKAMGLELAAIPVVIDGKDYLESVDLPHEEFYRLLINAKSIPVTAHISVQRFMDYFEQYHTEGYTDVIVITINSKGSYTYDSAVVGRNNFYEEHPELRESFHVYVVDSQSYSIGFAYPVTQALKKREDGLSAREIVAYLEDLAPRIEIYFSIMSLKWAKKSGRITVMAAFVGEMLGIKPIMRLADGEITMYDKVRGEKPVPSRLAEIAYERSADKKTYMTISGITNDVERKMIECMAEKTGTQPTMSMTIGPSIAINAGPDATAIMIIGEKRD